MPLTNFVKVGIRPFSLSAKAALKTPKPVINAEANNVINPINKQANIPGKPRYRTMKYVLSCLFTKNNTHFTYSAVVEDLNYLDNSPKATYNEMYLHYLQLPYKVKFALSTGHLGFRKSTRGEYDAAFQTAAKAFSLIEEKGGDEKIEIVMKEFGKGRQAFINALKGKEGSGIRNRIMRISDATKIKFGGTKSPTRRRL